MITAATLLQRIPARRMILLALLVLAVVAVAIVAAAFHGVPVHDHLAMSFNGPKSKMSFN